MIHSTMKLNQGSLQKLCSLGTNRGGNDDASHSIHVSQAGLSNVTVFGKHYVIFSNWLWNRLMAIQSRFTASNPWCSREFHNAYHLPSINFLCLALSWRHFSAPSSISSASLSFPPKSPEARRWREKLCLEKIGQIEAAEIAHPIFACNFVI